MADRRATRPCMGVPSTSAIMPVASTCGSAAMAAMSMTGAMAASAAAKAPRTSSAGRAAIQRPRWRRARPVLDPAGEGGEAGIVADADQPHHPAGHRVRRRRDGHPHAVGAAVGAARHGVRDARTEAGLLLAGQPVDGDERTHQLEQRLEQVDVDDLADAGVQGDHRGEGADEPGHLVRERDRREQRRPSGSPLMAA